MGLFDTFLNAGSSLVGGYLDNQHEKSQQGKAINWERDKMNTGTGYVDNFNPYEAWQAGYDAENAKLLENRQHAHDSALGLNGYEGFGDFDFAKEYANQELDFMKDYDPQYINRLKANDAQLNPQSTAMMNQLYEQLGVDPSEAGMNSARQIAQFYGMDIDANGNLVGSPSGGGSGSVSMPSMGSMIRVGSGPQLQLMDGGPTLSRIGKGPDLDEFDYELKELERIGEAPELQLVDAVPELQGFTDTTPQYQSGNYTDGETYMLRDKLQEMLLSDLESGGRLSDNSLDSVSQAVRARLAGSGGDLLGPAGVYTEALQVGELADSRRRDAMTSAMSFLQSGVTPQDILNQLRQEGNELAAREFSDKLSKLDFNNQTSVEQFGMMLQQVAQNNESINQMFGNQLAAVNQHNDATGQEFDMARDKLTTNNDVRNMEYANDLSRVGVNNQAALGEFQGQLSSVQTNNDALNQMFQNRVTGAGFDNNVTQTEYGAARSAAASANAQRNRVVGDMVDAWMKDKDQALAYQSQLAFAPNTITTYTTPTASNPFGQIDRNAPSTFVGAETNRMASGVNAATSGGSYPVMQSNSWNQGLGDAAATLVDGVGDWWRNRNTGGSSGSSSVGSPWV